jgi:hypothetical protein
MFVRQRIFLECKNYTCFVSSGHREWDNATLLCNSIVLLICVKFSASHKVCFEKIKKNCKTENLELFNLFSRFFGDSHFKIETKNHKRIKMENVNVNFIMYRY